AKCVTCTVAFALHLYRAYPDKPLFPTDPGKAHARFVNGWADASVNGAIFPLVVADLVDRVRPAGEGDGVESLSRRVGTSDFAAFQKTAREKGLAALRSALEPARRVLGEQRFLS